MIDLSAPYKFVYLIHKDGNSECKIGHLTGSMKELVTFYRRSTGRFTAYIGLIKSEMEGRVMEAILFKILKEKGFWGSHELYRNCPEMPNLFKETCAAHELQQCEVDATNIGGNLALKLHGNAFFLLTRVTCALNSLSSKVVTSR